MLSRCCLALLIALAAAEGRAVNDVRDGREDPTRPEQWVSTKTVSGVAVPKLNSVLIGGERRLAVIDGRVMSEGERRGGVTLWKVEADRVEVSLAGGGRVTLRLARKGMNKEVR